MTRDEMLEQIASYGFGVYSAIGRVFVADPQDDSDGYGIVTDTIEQAYAEWDSAWSLRDSN